MERIAYFILGLATVFIPFLLYMLWNGFIEIDFSKGIDIRYTEKYRELFEETREELKEERRRAAWRNRYKK